MTSSPICLRVLTFNAYHGYPLCPEIERRLELLVAGLRDQAPDIAFLQEISVSTLHGHLPQQLVARLEQSGLDYHLAYAPANGSVADGGVFEEGSAILSRFPIVESETRRLAAATTVRREYHGYEYEEFRIALRATLEIESGRRLDVFTTHVTDADPAGGESPRRRQIEDLARFVVERSNLGLPAIIGGDFNAPPEADEIRWLATRDLHDLCAAGDPGPTNDRHDRDLQDPRDTADQRIDYLFVAGRDFTVRNPRLFLAKAFEIEPGRFLWASDHSGIVADLELVAVR